MSTVATKERPILFSGPMVRAILDGRKTQTRRLVKPQSMFDGKDEIVRRFPNQTGHRFGKPGDRLWVKESHRPRVSRDGSSRGIEYRTDGRLNITEIPSVLYNAATHMIPLNLWAPSQEAALRANIDRWRPSIHMPRAACRIELEVVSVRVERVQDISEADILAEGVTVAHVAEWLGVPWESLPTLHDAWRALWVSINGIESWDRNDWVWVVTFKRITA